MKKILFTTFLFLLSSTVIFSQDVAPFRQFYFNPYLFNPAFVGSNGYTEFSLVYRRQWININDAPTITGFNLQLPTFSRVSVGLNVISQEVVALRNTRTLITFGYNVPIANDQFLRFGISGGMGLNNLNLNEGDYDPNDPVILNAMQNTYYLDGNFGIAYTNKNFNLGFSFLSLFDTKYVNRQESPVANFNQLKNRLFSASYKLPLANNNFQVEPILLFRQSANDFNFYEAMAMFYYKQAFWLGASYNNIKGAGFVFGAAINSFRFGYSYELPPVDKSFTNTSSHEIQISFRMGTKKGPSYKKNSQLISQTAATEAQTVADSSALNTQKEPADIIQEKKSEPVIVLMNPEKLNPVNADTLSKKEIAQKKPNPEEVSVISEEPLQKDVKDIEQGSPPKTFTLGKGHYVIVGAFRIMQNAINYSLDLQRRGYQNATVALNSSNRLYYVYIYSAYEVDEAKRVRNINRVKRLFQDAWVLTIE